MDGNFLGLLQNITYQYAISWTGGTLRGDGVKPCKMEFRARKESLFREFSQASGILSMDPSIVNGFVKGKLAVP